jgi:hypothetical protein
LSAAHPINGRARRRNAYFFAAGLAGADSAVSGAADGSPVMWQIAAGRSTATLSRSSAIHPSYAGLRPG